MKRGEIWTIAGASDYAGKPRPAVILQSDDFEQTNSITICAFTSNPTEAAWIRLVVEADEGNGLRGQSRLMIDKITTVAKSKVGSRIGRLGSSDLRRLERAILVFLGFAGRSRDDHG